jgi:hypothetical protein
MRLLTCTLLASLTFVASSVTAQTPPPPAPTTQVLALLIVKSDVPRTEVMKVLPDEVKATVRLHLNGKIQQWYGRADNRGVVFILNATSVDEAKRITAELPFEKGGIATFEYVALTPLTPLRLLLGPQ